MSDPAERGGYGPKAEGPPPTEPPARGRTAEWAKDHQHTELAAGDECPTCHRKVPQVAANSPTGRKRERFTFTVPTGEEGVLDEMLIQLVEKYEEAWPEDAAAARDGVGLVPVGERSWQYRALHFAAYAALTVPGLEPTE